MYGLVSLLDDGRGGIFDDIKSSQRGREIEGGGEKDKDKGLG